MNLAAAVLLLAGLVACGGDTTRATATGDARGDRPRTAEAASLQLADLPKGFSRCPYSGDMDSFVVRVRKISVEYADTAAATWERLKGAGATAGFAAFYGDSDEACYRIIVPATQADFASQAEHVRGHPRMVYSMVVQFPDAATAESAFKADAPGQSRLEDHVAMDLERGTPTNLGPNAVVVANRGSVVVVREAAWQNKVFNLMFRSAGIERSVSETATIAMDLRIGR